MQLQTYLLNDPLNVPEIEMWQCTQVNKVWVSEKTIWTGYNIWQIDWMSYLWLSNTYIYCTYINNVCYIQTAVNKIMDLGFFIINSLYHKDTEVCGKMCLNLIKILTEAKANTSWFLDKTEQSMSLSLRVSIAQHSLACVSPAVKVWPKINNLLHARITERP